MKRIKALTSLVVAVAAMLILAFGAGKPAAAQDGATAISGAVIEQPRASTSTHKADLGLAKMFGTPAQVTPGQGLEDTLPHVKFAPRFEGEFSLETLKRFAASEDFVDSRISNYGSPGTRFLLTVAVTNTGDKAGRWQLLTKRAGLPELTFAEWLPQNAGGEVAILRDRRDADVGQHLRTYHGFTHPFELEAGETRYFLVAFRGLHSSSLPLVIADPQEALQQQTFKTVAITASVASMLVLMLVATLFYLVTAGRHYLWLAIAELNHAAFVAHVNGYSIHYWLYDKGIWIYALGWIMPCVYGLAMVQFTRGLLETSVNLPRLDRMLNWLAALLAATLLMLFVAAFGSLDWLLQLASYPVPVSLTIYTFGLPFVGIIAVTRLGKQYLPLTLAWVIMAIFSAYFTIALLDLGVSLPFDAYFYGPVGVIVSLLMTMTMVLHMRKVMSDKQQSERELITSLEQRLELSEEKANALATINDQDQLIHASGHDSKQVLLALNSMIHVAESSGAQAPSPELTDILRASAKQLEAVISTTMDSSLAGSQSNATIALSRFSLADALRQLEMIYRPLAHKKGLTLRIPEVGDTVLISDRALLVRILSNMLSNAVKFSDRGRISIEFAAIGPDADTAMLAIEDQGIGMSPDLIAQIGESNQARTKGDPLAEGTGFGFKASVSMLDRIGGNLKPTSEPNKGTRIELHVPLIGGSVAHDLSEEGIALIDLDSPNPPAETDWDAAVAIASDRSVLEKHLGIVPPPVLLIRPLDDAMLRHPLLQTVENVAQTGKNDARTSENVRNTL